MEKEKCRYLIEQRPKSGCRHCGAICVGKPMARCGCKLCDRCVRVANVRRQAEEDSKFRKPNSRNPNSIVRRRLDQMQSERREAMKSSVVKRGEGTVVKRGDGTVSRRPAVVEDQTLDETVCMTKAAR